MLDSVLIVCLRKTWKLRKESAKYNECMKILDLALSNDMGNLSTRHIGYLRTLAGQCKRCKWLQNNGYSYENCSRRCKVKKEEFARFCMIVKTGFGSDFKAKSRKRTPKSALLYNKVY